ncbi:MAG TPA: hypothetical protein VIT91_06905, partial [Chthoniobacterales bacterium]
SLPLPSLQVVPGGAISCPGGVALSPPLEIRGFSRRTEAIFSHSSRGFGPAEREATPRKLERDESIPKGSQPAVVSPGDRQHWLRSLGDRADFCILSGGISRKGGINPRLLWL